MLDPLELFDAIAAEYAGWRGVSLGRVWHNDGLKADGRTFAMMISERLVVKVSAEQATALVHDAHGVAFEPRPGDKMREWVVVGDVDAGTWKRLIADAHAYVSRG